MLMTPSSVLEQHFGSGKKPFMAKFYEMQRKRLGVLLDADGGPLGGRWSFDADNRKKLPKGIVVPDGTASVGPPARGAGSAGADRRESARARLLG